MLEEFLKSKSVKYIKKVVDESDEARVEMMKESNGFLGVPFTVVTASDGKKENVVGFDQVKISALLGI